MIGKRIGSVLYIGYGAIITGQSGLQPALIQRVKTGAAFLPTDFRLDVVCVETRTGFMRFLQLNDLTLPHPYVEKSLVLPAEETHHLYPGRIQRQIYHRLDSILHPEHPRYPFYRAVTQFEEAHGLLGTPNVPRGIGYPKVWQAWVSSHMPWVAYLASMEELRKQWL
jgi:hypothetical protein